MVNAKQRARKESVKGRARGARLAREPRVRNGMRALMTAKAGCYHRFSDGRSRIAAPQAEPLRPESRRAQEVVAGLGEPAYRASSSTLALPEARAVHRRDDGPRQGPARDARRAPRAALAGGRRAALSYDGTVKYLFRLDDGATIESVYIPEERAPHHLHLDPGRLPAEVRVLPDRDRRLQAQPEAVGDPRPGGHGDGGGAAPREQPWNIVVMGMGEPLLNYDATVAALRVLMDPEGFAVAPKKLTLSTVGILPALEKLMQEPVRPNLAISLHAPERGAAARADADRGAVPARRT